MTTILISLLALALFISSAIVLVGVESKWAAELREDVAREHLVP